MTQQRAAYHVPLGQKCRGGHRHQALAGGRAAAAAAHPPQLHRAIIPGEEAHRRREGQALPEATLASMTTVGLRVPPAGPASAGVTPPAVVDPAVIDDRLHHEEEHAKAEAEEGT